MAETLEDALSHRSFGPEAYHLADWRRRIQSLYARLRSASCVETAHAEWIETRSWLFRNHPSSPLPEAARAKFPGIAAFPYDPGLRVHVDLRSADGPEVHVDLGRDGALKLSNVAMTNGLSERLGAELPVFWIGGYGGGLFLPFRDATSGAATFGGGRYLIDAIKGSDLGLDKDGRLILDFNFSYNPSCALSDEFVCPLAPPESSVPVAVEGGETHPKA